MVRTVAPTTGYLEGTRLIGAESYDAEKRRFLREARDISATLYSAPHNYSLMENASSVVLNMGNLDEPTRIRHLNYIQYARERGVEVETYSTPSSRARLHWKSYTGLVEGERAALLTTGNLPYDTTPGLFDHVASLFRYGRTARGSFQANIAIYTDNDWLVGEIQEMQRLVANPTAALLSNEILRVGADSSAAIHDAIMLAAPGDRVTIASPYIDSSETILQLLVARERGVDVALLTSSPYSEFGPAAGGRQDRDRILAAAVKAGIPVYVPPDVLEGSYFLYHLKAAAIETSEAWEGLAVVGSHNRTMAADRLDSLDVDAHFNNSALAAELGAELRSHIERYDMQLFRPRRGIVAPLSRLDARAYLLGGTQVHQLYRPDVGTHYLAPTRYDSALFYDQAELGYRFEPYALSQRYQWIVGVDSIADVPISIRRLDEAMQRPSLGHRFNMFIGSALYQEGEGPLGIFTRGLGRALDTLTGHYRYQEELAILDGRYRGSIGKMMRYLNEPHELPVGLFESILSGAFDYLQATAITGLFYVGVSLPINQITGYLGQLTFEYLLSNKGPTTGISGQIYGLARSTMFGSALVNDIVEGVHFTPSDTNAQIKEGLLGFMLNTRRMYGQQRYRDLMMPLLSMFNPYRPAAGGRQSEYFAQYIQALEQLSTLLGQQAAVKTIDEGQGVVRQVIKNIGADRIHQVAKQYDVIGRLLPANLLYYIPSLRKYLAPFDPETMVTLGGGPDEGLFSFEEIYHTIEQTRKTISRVISQPGKVFAQLQHNIAILRQQQQTARQIAWQRDRAVEIYKNQFELLKRSLGTQSADPEEVRAAFNKATQLLLEDLNLPTIFDTVVSQADLQRRLHLQQLEQFEQPPAATPDPNNVRRKVVGDTPLRQVRTLIGAAAVALSINKALDYFVFANQGIDLFSQLLALPDAYAEGGEVFRQQLVGTLPSALTVGVGLGMGITAGYLLADAVYVPATSPQGEDLVDFILQVRQNWIQQLGANRNAGAALQAQDAAFQNIAKNRAARVQLRYNKTAALLVGIAAPVLLQTAVSTGTLLLNYYTGRDQGVFIDPQGFATSTLLTRAAADQIAQRGLNRTTQAALEVAHRHMITAGRDIEVRTLAHQFVSPFFQFPIAMRESAGVATLSIGMQLPPLVSQGFMITLPVGVRTQPAIPTELQRSTLYSFSLADSYGNLETPQQQILAFVRATADTLTLGRFSGTRVWDDEQNRWLYSGSGLTWVPDSTLQQSLEFVGAWSLIGAATEIIAPELERFSVFREWFGRRHGIQFGRRRPPAAVSLLGRDSAAGRFLRWAGSTFVAGVAGVAATPFQVIGSSIRSAQHFFQPTLQRLGPEKQQSLESMRATVGGTFARIPSVVKAYYASYLLMRIMSDATTGYSRADEETFDWRYTELAPAIAALPLAMVVDASGFMQSSERLYQRANQLRQQRIERRGARADRVTGRIYDRFLSWQERLFRTMSGRFGVGQEIAEYNQYVARHRTAGTPGFTEADFRIVPPGASGTIVLPEGATAVERRFYQRYIQADARAMRTRVRVAGMVFAGLAVAGALVTSFVDSDLRHMGLQGHLLRLLGRVEPEDRFLSLMEQTGGPRRTYRGISGLLTRFGDMLSFGRVSRLTGAYTDESDPFASVLFYGSTFRSDQRGYRRTYYFQVQSEESDLSTSQFYMRMRSPRADEITWAVRQLAGHEQADLGTMLARLRGTPTRNRAAQYRDLGRSEIAAVSHSPSLMTALNLRRFMMEHFSWQRPVEHEMDFFGYSETLLGGFGVDLNQFYARETYFDDLTGDGVFAIGRMRRFLSLDAGMIADRAGQRISERTYSRKKSPAEMLVGPFAQMQELTSYLPAIGPVLSFALGLGGGAFILAGIMLSLSSAARIIHYSELGIDLAHVQQHYRSAVPEGAPFELGRPARFTVNGVFLYDPVNNRLAPLRQNLGQLDPNQAKQVVGRINRSFALVEDALNRYTTNYRDRLIGAFYRAQGEGAQVLEEFFRTDGTLATLNQKLRNQLGGVLSREIRNRSIAEIVFGKTAAEVVDELLNANALNHLGSQLHARFTALLSKSGITNEQLMAEFAQEFENAPWFEQVYSRLQRRTQARVQYDSKQHVRRIFTSTSVAVAPQRTVRDKLMDYTRLAGTTFEWLAFRLPDYYTLFESVGLLLDDSRRQDPYLRRAAADNLVLTSAELLVVPLLTRLFDRIMPSSLPAGGFLAYFGMMAAAAYFGQRYRSNPIVQSLSQGSAFVQRGVAEAFNQTGRVLGPVARAVRLPQMVNYFTETVSGPLLTDWWLEMQDKHPVAQTLTMMLLPRSAYYGRLNLEMGRQTWLGREPWVYGNPILMRQFMQEQFLARSAVLERGIDETIAHSYYLGRRAYTFDTFYDSRYFESPAGYGRVADAFDLSAHETLSASLQAALRVRQFYQDHLVAGRMMDRVERAEMRREAITRGVFERGFLPLLTRSGFVNTQRYGTARMSALMQALDMRYLEQLSRREDATHFERLEARTGMRAGQASTVFFGLGRAISANPILQLGMALVGGYAAAQMIDYRREDFDEQAEFGVLSGTTFLSAATGSFGIARHRVQEVGAFALDAALFVGDELRQLVDQTTSRIGRQFSNFLSLPKNNAKVWNTLRRRTTNVGLGILAGAITYRLLDHYDEAESPLSTFMSLAIAAQVGTLVGVALESNVLPSWYAGLRKQTSKLPRPGIGVLPIAGAGVGALLAYLSRDPEQEGLPSRRMLIGAGLGAGLTAGVPIATKALLDHHADIAHFIFSHPRSSLMTAGLLALGASVWLNWEDLVESRDIKALGSLAMTGTLASAAGAFSLAPARVQKLMLGSLAAGTVAFMGVQAARDGEVPIAPAVYGVSAAAMYFGRQRQGWRGALFGAGVGLAVTQFMQDGRDPLLRDYVAGSVLGAATLPLLRTAAMASTPQYFRRGIYGALLGAAHAHLDLVNRRDATPLAYGTRALGYGALGAATSILLDQALLARQEQLKAASQAMSGYFGINVTNVSKRLSQLPQWMRSPLTAYTALGAGLGFAAGMTLFETQALVNPYQTLALTTLGGAAVGLGFGALRTNAGQRATQFIFNDAMNYAGYGLSALEIAAGTEAILHAQRQVDLMAGIYEQRRGIVGLYGSAIGRVVGGDFGDFLGSLSTLPAAYLRSLRQDALLEDNRMILAIEEARSSARVAELQSVFAQDVLPAAGRFVHERYRRFVTPRLTAGNVALPVTDSIRPIPFQRRFTDWARRWLRTFTPNPAQAQAAGSVQLLRASESISEAFTEVFPLLGYVDPFMSVSGTLQSIFADTEEARLAGRRRTARASGSIFGSLLGSLLGFLVSGDPIGAAIGAISGAITGEIIGDQLGDELDRGLAPILTAFSAPVGLLQAVAQHSLSGATVPTTIGALAILRGVQGTVRGAMQLSRARTREQAIEALQRMYRTSHVMAAVVSASTDLAFPSQASLAVVDMVPDASGAFAIKTPSTGAISSQLGYGLVGLVSGQFRAYLRSAMVAHRYEEGTATQVDMLDELANVMYGQVGLMRALPRIEEVTTRGLMAQVQAAATQQATRTQVMTAHAYEVIQGISSDINLGLTRIGETAAQFGRSIARFGIKTGLRLGAALGLKAGVFEATRQVGADAVSDELIRSISAKAAARKGQFLTRTSNLMRSPFVEHAFDIAQAGYGVFQMTTSDDPRLREQGAEHVAVAAGRTLGYKLTKPLAVLAATTVASAAVSIPIVGWVAAPVLGALTYTAVSAIGAFIGGEIGRFTNRFARDRGWFLEDAPLIKHAREYWLATQEHVINPLWHTHVTVPRRQQQLRRQTLQFREWEIAEYRRTGRELRPDMVAWLQSHEENLPPSQRRSLTPAEPVFEITEPKETVERAVSSSSIRSAFERHNTVEVLDQIEKASVTESVFETHSSPDEEEPIYSVSAFVRPERTKRKETSSSDKDLIVHASPGFLNQVRASEPVITELTDEERWVDRASQAEVERQERRLQATSYLYLEAPEERKLQLEKEKQRQHRLKQERSWLERLGEFLLKAGDHFANVIGLMIPSVRTLRYAFQFIREESEKRAKTPSISYPTTLRSPATETEQRIIENAAGSAIVSENAPFDQAFLDRAIQVAANIGMDPDYLLAIMSFESAGTFSSSIQNPHSNATGLIQFIPSTAAGLGYTIDELKAMTPLEQLDVVEKYFQPYRGRLHSLEDAYMAVLFPVAIGRGSNDELFKQGTREYVQNRGLDINGDGVITVGEATSKVQEHLALVQSYRQSVTDGSSPGASPGRNGSGVAELALGWAGEHFRPGVTEQCAYFVRHVYQQAGIELGVTKSPFDAAAVGHSRTGAGFANSLIGEDIGEIITDKSQLQPGDIVSWGGTYGGWGKDVITHVGIYVGNGMVIDRPTAGAPVRYRSIDTFPHFVAGVRPHGLPALDADEALERIATVEIGSAAGTGRRNVTSVDLPATNAVPETRTVENAAVLNSSQPPQSAKPNVTVSSAIAGVTLEQMSAYQPSVAQGFYGQRSGGRQHSKVDFDARIGAGQDAVITAMQGGIASYVPWTETSGMVRVETVDAQGRNVTYEYGHLSLASIQETFAGQSSVSVEPGQKLGRVTMDSLSSAPHLCLGVLINGEYVDPQVYIRDVLLPAQRLATELEAQQQQAAVEQAPELTYVSAASGTATEQARLLDTNVTGGVWRIEQSIHGVDPETINQALQFYQERGLTKLGTAYLVGNLIQESALDPHAVGDGGRARGLAQWHPDRRVDMPDTYEGQLEFVLIEMGRDGGARQARTLETLKDPNATVEQIKHGLRRWERYGVAGQRYEYGRQIYELLNTQPEVNAPELRVEVPELKAVEDPDVVVRTFAKGEYLDEEAVTQLLHEYGAAVIGASEVVNQARAKQRMTVIATNTPTKQFETRSDSAKTYGWHFHTQPQVQEYEHEEPNVQQRKAGKEVFWIADNLTEDYNVTQRCDTGMYCRGEKARMDVA